MTDAVLITPSEDAEPAAEGSSKKPLLFAVAALVVGGAVGALVVAPRIGAKAPPAAEAHAAEEDAGGGHGEEGGAQYVKIESIIVNPAGSDGMRYLVLSVAYQVSDSTPEGQKKAEARLKNAEVELRDRIAGTLERKSLVELTQPGARDSMRAILAEVAAPYLKGAKVKVFVPQFLIQ